MKDYKFYQLIYNYQLEVSKMPLKLYNGIVAFNHFYNEAIHTDTGRNLLASLDNNLSIGLVNWITDNKENLKEITCTYCNYKDFYKIMFEKLSEEPGNYSRYYGSQEAMLEGGPVMKFYLTFLKSSTFDDCLFYTLFFNVNAVLQASVIFKVCLGAQTAEPIYWEEYNSGSELMAYNYMNEQEPIDWEAKRELDKKIKQLLDILITSGFKFKPIRNNLKEIIKKLKIT